MSTSVLAPYTIEAPVAGSTVPESVTRMSVIGTGYLGATHAICMAVLGFDVIGVDVDRRKIDSLSDGVVPFFEPELAELLAKALDSGKLQFSTSFAEAAAHADVHFLCVGTPQMASSHAADVSYVRAAAQELARHIDRPGLIVGKSTVPVGTATSLRAFVRRVSPAGDRLDLAWNPEFLREGFAVEDTFRPDRLVFGTDSEYARTVLHAVFAPVIALGTPVVETDLPTAELVKVAANSFLATKISYINAMAEVCEATGADVSHLAKALSYDSRIGGRFLQPGLGFGGGCLPKDIRAFRHRAEELGIGQAVAFLHEVDAINLRRRARTVDLVQEMAGGSLAGARVAALGAAFKPNSDDIRDAPALDVARMLHEAGAVVTVYDPVAMSNARAKYPELNYGASVMEAARHADVVVLLTEWNEFRTIDPEALGSVVSARRVVDGRHALPAEQWRAAGWEYRALGRS